MEVTIDSRVKYSTSFLRSIGAITGELGFARGVITNIENLGSLKIATIDWGDESISAKVNIKNLVSENRMG